MKQFILLLDMCTLKYEVEGIKPKKDTGLVLDSDYTCRNVDWLLSQSDRHWNDYLHGSRWWALIEELFPNISCGSVGNGIHYPGTNLARANGRGVVPATCVSLEGSQWCLWRTCTIRQFPQWKLWNQLSSIASSWL